MEATLTYLIDYLNSFLGFIWLPIGIWSLFAGIVWFIIKNMEQLHPQYHYQVRLGILFSLPAGLLMLAAIQGIEKLLQGTEEPLNLAFFTVSYPVEVSVSPVQSQSLFSYSEILALAFFGLYAAGVLYTLLKITIQWLKLRSLRSSNSLQLLFSLKNLDSENMALIKSIKKPVFILFVDEPVIPVTFGYNHPVLVLPRSLRSDSEKCNLVIRHELTHISQNDFITHLLVVVTKSIFWFHPLIHRLHDEIIEYRELRCDSLILSEQSVSRKKYAQLLLELLPLANINKELSVNMAQESSNLKKRIQMITQSHYKQKHSKRISLAIFSSILMITVFAMACTDMQTENVFDEEDQVSNVMTDLDRTGERGFHEIVIFRGENGEMESHQGKIDNLDNLPPDIIKSIDVFKGEKAVELYGEQGKHGVIVIKTHTDPTAYNTAMKALGMEADMPPPPPRPNEEPDVAEGYFVVVEEMPQIIGGIESIMSEVQYPEMARRAGIEGRVFVQFVVNEEGNVEDAEVVRGIGGGADEEALRVVRQAKFKPGVQRGRPVRVKYSLPIMFSLGNDETVVQGQATAQVEQPTAMAKKMTVEVQNDNGILRGRVLDGETNRPLPGANIIVAGTSTGSTTDVNGSFAIRTDGSDDVELIFSYVGYERASMSITR
jgi:TonB family protein